MSPRSIRTRYREAGQASLLMLGVVTLLLGLAVVLFAFGSALGSKGKHQRAADLAAVSAGQVMRELYPRLFEPPVLANGLPNPRHLPLPVYLALVRAAAVRGARRNGVEVRGADVSFPGGGFAPTRVAVRVRGVARVRVKQDAVRRVERVPVEARAVAEIAPDLNVPLGMPAFGSGGGYDGPLAYRMGKPSSPKSSRSSSAAGRRIGRSRHVSGSFERFLIGRGQTRSLPSSRAQTTSAAKPLAPTPTVCSPSSSPVAAETAAIVCERLWVSAPSTIIDLVHLHFD